MIIKRSCISTLKEHLVSISLNGALIMIAMRRGNRPFPHRLTTQEKKARHRPVKCDVDRPPITYTYMTGTLVLCGSGCMGLKCLMCFPELSLPLTFKRVGRGRPKSSQSCKVPAIQPHLLHKARYRKSHRKLWWGSP